MLFTLINHGKPLRIDISEDGEVFTTKVEHDDEIKIEADDLESVTLTTLEQEG